MKKLLNKSSLLFIFLVIGLSATLLTSCGQSKEAEERDIKTEDSLANIQSNEALERANQLLESDSLSDTTKKSK
jgi:hypothetical protein